MRDRHLADRPSIGHRRPDLTAHDELFYKVFSYIVTYLRVLPPLQILGILHGNLDLARILKSRM